MASASMLTAGKGKRVDEGDGEGDLVAVSALRWLRSLGVSGRVFLPVTQVLVERLGASTSASGCVGVDAASSGSSASFVGVDAAYPKLNGLNMGEE